jgi:tetratricopeptide (TPR) repeat protein
MDGKVLNDVFIEPPLLDRIESWDTEPGDAGQHPPDARIDTRSSAEAFQQLVDLGYVAPPGPDTRKNVEQAISELKYNLARACLDGSEQQRAATLLHEIWEDHPQEHRFGATYIEVLGMLGRLTERRQAIETLTERIERYAREAEEKLKVEEKKERKPDAKPTPAEEYELRRWRELIFPRPKLLAWLRTSQSLLERDISGARREFKKLGDLSEAGPELWLRAAGACVQMGQLDRAAEFVQRVLAVDPESHAALSLAAEIHFRQKKPTEAIKAATDSLSLIYFQPALHALLGEALLETGQLDAAEKELQVALAQYPGLVRAHETLARLYREHRPDPAKAFAHEGRARSMRIEARTHRQSSAQPARSKGAKPSPLPPPTATARVAWPGVPADQIVTIVTGLPRSGTSMMMQVLAAGGFTPLMDEQRPADSDNPFGYLEFQPAIELARNAKWIPQARGKAVKIVAQLLPFLPPGEKYQVLFMHRDLQEIVASQRAMLERLGREGGRLEEDDLMTVFRNQLQVVLAKLAQRDDVRVLHLQYVNLTESPAEVVSELATFLGGKLDCQRAASAIRPELRRQRLGQDRPGPLDAAGTVPPV